MNEREYEDYSEALEAIDVELREIAAERKNLHEQIMETFTLREDCILDGFNDGTYSKQTFATLLFQVKEEREAWMKEVKEKEY